MMKKQLGNHNALYPTPTTLVGVTVNNKPNFITIAHVGILTLTKFSMVIKRYTTRTRV
jgi:hypothetical protein